MNMDFSRYVIQTAILLVNNHHRNMVINVLVHMNMFLFPKWCTLAINHSVWIVAAANIHKDGINSATNWWTFVPLIATDKTAESMKNQGIVNGFLGQNTNSIDSFHT